MPGRGKKGVRPFKSGLAEFGAVRSRQPRGWDRPNPYWAGPNRWTAPGRSALCVPALRGGKAGYSWEVHLEETAMLLHDSTTSRELRDLSTGPADAPATFLRPRGVTKHFADDDMILEERDPPLAGKIMFQAETRKVKDAVGVLTDQSGIEDFLPGE